MKDVLCSLFEVYLLSTLTCVAQVHEKHDVEQREQKWAGLTALAAQHQQQLQQHGAALPQQQQQQPPAPSAAAPLHMHPAQHAAQQHLRQNGPACRGAMRPRGPAWSGGQGPSHGPSQGLWRVRYRAHRSRCSGVTARRRGGRWTASPGRKLVAPAPGETAMVCDAVVPPTRGLQGAVRMSDAGSAINSPEAPLGPVLSLPNVCCSPDECYNASCGLGRPACFRRTRPMQMRLMMRI